MKKPAKKLAVKRERARPWIGSRGIAILRQVQKRIANDPNSYRQDEWHCGTAACIAGHICMTRKDATIVKSEFNSGYELRINGVGRPFMMTAAETLGVDVNALSSLFSGSPSESEYPYEQWPQPFADEWRRARTRAAKAAVAVRRIDHFIETGF